MHLHAVRRSLFSMPLAMSLCLYLPLASAQVAIPASQRIGDDGRIGSANPLTAAQGPHRGMCAKWAKENVPSGSSITDASKAERLLDNVPPDVSNPATLDLRAGDQSTPQRRGRFFARAPVLDFESFGIVGLHSPSLTVPWHGGTCRLQGTSGSAPNVVSLGPAFAGRFRGNLHIPQAGTYTVLIRSDDGYALRIGGTEVSSFRLDRGQASDSKRVVFSAAGVYTVELVYYDSGGGSVLEVFLAFADVCFSGAGTQTLENPCTTGVDLVSVNLSALPPNVFKLLDYQLVDFPTWVASSSDSAFSIADETCALEEADSTCGPPSNTACGNGVRERVNVGTLGTPMFSDEPCDDGNLTNGDGCSSTCAVETDFLCANGPISACALPRPTMLSPATGTSTNKAQPEFTGTALVSTTVSIYLDNATTPSCSTVTSAAGTFRCVASSTLGEGTHVAVAKAVNALGVESPSSSMNTFTIDTVAPSVSLVSPLGTIADVRPRLTGTCEPGAQLRVYLDDSVQPTCTVTVDASGTFECVPPGDVSIGPHRFTAEAEDAASNVSARPTPLEFVVMDATFVPRPTTITQPVDGTTTGRRPLTAGTAEPGSTVIVTIDGAKVCEVLADASGNWSCPLEVDLSRGPHTVRARPLLSAASSSPEALVGFTVEMGDALAYRIGCGCENGSERLLGLLSVVALAVTRKRRSRWW